MKEYGKVRSTKQPEQKVIDDYSVWIAENITPVTEAGTDEQPGFTGYEYDLTQYTKTDTGSLESKAGWKGLCRKCMTLIFVLVAYRLDLVIGTNYIRDAVIIAFIANETISLVENAGLMGLPLPAVITKAIDILQKKTESEGK